MIAAYKLTGDGVAIIHYRFHLSGLRSIPLRRRSVAQGGRAVAQPALSPSKSATPLVNTQTHKQLLTGPALVFWRPYANCNLAAPVGDHEAERSVPIEAYNAKYMT